MANDNKQIYILYYESVYAGSSNVEIAAFDNHQDAEAEYIKVRNNILQESIESNYDNISVNDDLHHVITYKAEHYCEHHDVLKLIIRTLNDTTLKDL